jgi:hypothetical protein
MGPDSLFGGQDFFRDIHRASFVDQLITPP